MQKEKDSYLGFQVVASAYELKGELKFLLLAYEKMQDAQKEIKELVQNASENRFLPSLDRTTSEEVLKAWEEVSNVTLHEDVIFKTKCLIDQIYNIINSGEPLEFK